MDVDVNKVKGRRRVHFENLQDMLSEAERLAQGPVQQLGNLSLGQTCGHLATWMNLSIDGGIPMEAPAWLRVVARAFKGLLLSRPLPAGYKLPLRAKQILIPAPEISTDEGLQQLRAAIRRLEHESGRVPSPMLGPLNVADWNRLHCRHAELHFSFLLPAKVA